MLSWELVLEQTLLMCPSSSHLYMLHRFSEGGFAVTKSMHHLTHCMQVHM